MSEKEYPRNEIDWKVGDLVIHAADWKDSSMLMRVIDIEKPAALYDAKGHFEGFKSIYVTEYVHPTHIKKIGKRFVKRKAFRNVKDHLLDPKNFEKINLTEGCWWK